MSKNQEIILNDSAIKFLKEETGATTVVANPTLAGTEANLTGLQVGNTKYAVPQGGGSGGIDFIPLLTTIGTLTEEEVTRLQNGAIFYVEESYWAIPTVLVSTEGGAYLTYTSTMNREGIFCEVSLTENENGFDFLVRWYQATVTPYNPLN